MTGPANDTARQRAALAAAEAELARLRTRYDVLMNAFKFDEARTLTVQIEAVERERAGLAAALPRSTADKPRPYSVARRPRRRR